MSAGMGRRFVLSIPNVDVCLTAPRNPEQLAENLAAPSTRGRSLR